MPASFHVVCQAFLVTLPGYADCTPVNGTRPISRAASARKRDILDRTTSQRSLSATNHRLKPHS